MSRRITFLILGLFISLSFSQQGKYKRKSITSLGLYKVSGNTLKDYGNSEYLELITEQIKNPRFDYNLLPRFQIYAVDFRNVVKRPKFNPLLHAQLFPWKAGWLEAEDPPAIVDFEILEEILSNSVFKKMLDILNDPELIKIRGSDLLDESDYQSFAMTKAKSLGITIDEISQIMNSSYVYLPYIEKEWEPEGSLFTVRGGILCWHLQIDNTGVGSLC
jgi:hypothetical protein